VAQIDEIRRFAPERAGDDAIIAREDVVMQAPPSQPRKYASNPARVSVLRWPSSSINSRFGAARSGASLASAER
jgi:hypothetical protein